MYKVGIYTFDPAKPFKNMNDAVKFIQERYPELTEEEIEKHLTPGFDGKDSEPDGVHNESSESGEAIAETDKGRIQAGRVSKSK